MGKNTGYIKRKATFFDANMLEKWKKGVILWEKVGYMGANVVKTKKKGAAWLRKAPVEVFLVTGWDGSKLVLGDIALVRAYFGMSVRGMERFRKGLNERGEVFRILDKEKGVCEIVEVLWQM